MSAAPPPPSQPTSPPPQPGSPVSQSTTSGVVALVFGILQFVALPVIGTIVALVAGYLSRSEVERDPTRNDDLGRIGRILGWIGVALAAAFALLAVIGVILWLVLVPVVR